MPLLKAPVCVSLSPHVSSPFAAFVTVIVGVAAIAPIVVTSPEPPPAKPAVLVGRVAGANNPNQTAFG
jgi:hypothetical protein